MKVDGKHFRSIWRERDGWSVGAIDQRRLPHEFVVARLTSCEDAAMAIREMLVRGASLIAVEQDIPMLPGERPQMVMCRMRSLGCSPCTGAIRSDADTVPKIIEEMMLFRRSERENRVIDHDQEGSMEIKKREGYF